jgi:DNA-binding CsgD family transcriptional regulator/tetratricopeptide (TPR) repeat protein
MVSVAARGRDPTLLERDESIAALDARIASVRSGSEGMFVWIGGEAGVGKTALLRHFCGRQAKPVRILWGACEPLRTPRPLGPFVDVAQETGGELAQLVAAAGRPYEVAAAVLEELHGRGPTVLVLEDLQWSDEATLDVIMLVATRIGSVPALALASYRDDELHRAPGLRIVLGEVARHQARLKVESLSWAGVAALAEPYGLHPGELYERTGGNPFFVTEVLAAGGERLPETVRDAVLARASRLSDDGRRLLEAVAIVPGQVEVPLLQAVAGRLVDQVDECLASGVLTAGPANVAFRHELARLAVEGAMAPHRRLALNRAALAALVSREDPDFARLAHHADAACDAEAVLQWAPRAATRAAASGAHREAAEQYARALRFADGQPPEVSARLLEGLAEECYLTSRIDEAIDAQRNALECRRRLGDQRAAGNALRVLSRLLFFAGRASEAEPLVLEAIELLEREPAGHELAMAYANVSQRRMVVEETAEAVAWGNRALELARSLGDTEAEVYALSNIGAATFLRDPDTGRIGLEAALEQALRHGHEELAGLTFSRLVMFPVRYRQFEIASQHLDAGLAHCTDRGLDTFRLYLLACRARLALDTGHWDEASDLAASVLRDPRAAHVGSSWALTTLGLVRARRGDPEAFAPLEEANALVTPTFELDRIAQVTAAQAEAAWLAGHQDRVAGITDAAFALALDRQEPWAVGELACWRWRTGVRDEFRAELAAEPYRLSLTGDWRAAAERWRTIGCPYEAALAMADADDEVALRGAVDELQSLGARPAAAIVARRLRQRGIRGVPRGPRRSTRENPAGLTVRELEVLAMLTEGLRNADIAARLVVSEKTVDHHVSAILRKLNARTRGEAAAEAARLGLTTPT